MCGIFGSPNITPSVRRMLPYLGIAMEERGRDAWGCSNGETILRHVGPLTESWCISEGDINGWEAGIFHTRGASHGSAKNLENAHPFSYKRKDGSWVIGIHNGIISNHAELDTKYNRKCDVDSMHIWMHRAEGKDWGDLHGWGNLAWWEDDKHGDRRMNLARFNNDALHVAELKDGAFIFCSTIAPMRTVARMFGNPVERIFHLEENTHYWFGLNSEGNMHLWKEKEALPFAQPKIYIMPHRGWNGGSGNNSLSDSYCRKCNQTRVYSKDKLLCDYCIAGLLTDFISWQSGANSNPSATHV